jgi:hypothetical protein
VQRRAAPAGGGTWSLGMALRCGEGFIKVNFSHPGDVTTIEH